MHFADKLQKSIEHRKSFIVAGLDPVLESFPAVILEQAAAGTASNEEMVFHALVDFYFLAIEALEPHVAAVKPNLGFFEQYGAGGLRAFSVILQKARECQLPVIVDAKVGDIGSTARSYSAAFIGRSSFAGRTIATFDADALTVNPFLGFDTLEPFLSDCREYGKGIFVLLKTSNPGSADIQDARLPDGKTISERIAGWLAKHSADLRGSCGYSSLGAVVGATHPAEAQHLRNLLPDNIFLIPGMGAQGGTADDAVQGFSRRGGGAIVNLSRGLLSAFSSPDLGPIEIRQELEALAMKFNTQINSALKKMTHAD